MTVLSYLVVLSLPFLMPFVARYLEDLVEKREKTKVKPKVQYQAAAPVSEVSEALQILDLGPNPSEYEIKLAHRQMIARNHPDQGGSIYFASKINYARDVLLRDACSL